MTTTCVSEWVVLVVLVLLGGSGGVDAILRLAEMRYGGGRDGRRSD